MHQASSMMREIHFFPCISCEDNSEKYTFNSACIFSCLGKKYCANNQCGPFLLKKQWYHGQNFTPAYVTCILVGASMSAYRLLITLCETYLYQLYIYKLSAKGAEKMLAQIHEDKT